MRIEVLTTQWAHDGGVLAGGVHEIEKPSKKLLGQAALAESVGSIKVMASTEERATMRASIEPDAESEKRLAKAQADSTWHDGNLGDYIAQKTQLLKNTDLDAETRAQLELGIGQAKAIQKKLAKQKTRDYDAAVREVLGG